MHTQVHTPSEVDFEQLYENHTEYVARRAEGSFQHAQIQLEAKGFKIPFICSQMPKSPLPQSILEIGCATGEIIGNMPVREGGRRIGCDISPLNVAAAKKRFPDVEFYSGNFMDLQIGEFDVVILSDILEHVEDDAMFLRCAGKLGRRIVVNLPLETNWLNWRREYGPNDSSGHLRKYSLKNGFGLFERAGLTIDSWTQIWIHELPIDNERRKLRAKITGKSYEGSIFASVMKSMVFRVARSVPPLGRRLFASNLFASAPGFVH